MKKKCIYFIFLFLPVFTIGQIQLGVNGGYDFFCFSHYDDSPYTPKYSYPNNAYLVAISARQRTKDVFNLGLEIQYAHRSFAVKSRWGGHGSGYNADLHFSVGEILLQIQPQFVIGSKVKFFMYPGFYFGSMLHSTLNGTISYWSITSPYTKYDTIHGSAKHRYSGLEFGISPGFGFEFPVNNNLSIVFESVFSMNLTEISDFWGYSNDKMLNLSFTVGVAYILPMKTSKSSYK